MVAQIWNQFKHMSWKYLKCLQKFGKSSRTDHVFLDIIIRSKICCLAFHSPSKSSNSIFNISIRSTNKSHTCVYHSISYWPHLHTQIFALQSRYQKCFVIKSHNTDSYANLSKTNYKHSASQRCRVNTCWTARPIRSKNVRLFLRNNVKNLAGNFINVKAFEIIFVQILREIKFLKK